MNAMRLLPVASTIIELVCVASSNRQFALHLPPRAKEQECFASFIASTITAFIAFSSGVSFFFSQMGKGVYHATYREVLPCLVASTSFPVFVLGWVCFFEKRHKERLKTNRSSSSPPYHLVNLECQTMTGLRSKLWPTFMHPAHTRRGHAGGGSCPIKGDNSLRVSPFSLFLSQ